MVKPSHLNGFKILHGYDRSNLFSGSSGCGRPQVQREHAPGPKLYVPSLSSLFEKPTPTLLQFPLAFPGFRASSHNCEATAADPEEPTSPQKTQTKSGAVEQEFSTGATAV